MDQSELLRYCTTVLEQLGLRYFVTGSVATIFYGEPRFTNDIDIVVALPASHISDFCRAFPSEDFYVSEEAMRRAVSCSDGSPRNARPPLRRLSRCEETIP